MAKGFDISKIEVKDSDKNIEKLLTGDVEAGLRKDDPRKPNAEIEGDEFLKYPNGKVKKAEGPKHENGGIKVNLPTDTEVVSDSIHLTKSEAKRLSGEFDLNFSTKDTYASALDKYSKKIGLTKLNDEQEDVFSVLKKEIEKKAVDKGTSQINNEYLSKKIYDIESKKKPLEDKRKKFFDKVFDIQESKKKQENQEGEFKFGGVQEQAFQNLLKKYNLSEEEGRRAMNDLPLFDKGGEFITRIEAGEDADKIYADLRKASIEGSISETEYNDVLKKYYQKYPGTTTSAKDKTRLRGTYVDNEFKNEERVYQKSNQTNYGTEKDPQTILVNLYENFPDIISDEKVFGKYIDQEALKKGEVKFKDNLPLNKEQAAVLEFQKRADKRMRASANDIIKNPDNFSEETVAKAEDYLKNETFVEDSTKAKTPEERIRLYDKKMGNFTSGRYSLKLDLVTPEESKLLKSKGVYTANQITPEILAELSPESQNRVKRLKEIKSEESDYNINVYTPDEGEVKAPAEEGPIKDEVDLSTRQKGARAFYTPDQSVLPPSGLQPGMLANNEYQRTDPIKIGIDRQLQSAAENRNFLASQVDSLPPAQRAAALASLLSTTQSYENEASYNANITNAQNQAAAEQFNIGQSDRENIAQGSNLLNFEGRSLMAKANTEADLREYLRYNHNVAMNNFSNTQQLNLISNLTPDYSLDYYGMGVNYDPYYDFQIKNNDNLNRIGLGPTNTTEQSVDAEA